MESRLLPTTPAPELTQTETPLWSDQAESILRNDRSLDDSKRALLFDVYHDAKNPEELARRLQYFNIPNSTKSELYAAKARTALNPSPVDRAVSALNRVARLPQNVLEAVERFPTTARALVASALKGFDTK